MSPQLSGILFVYILAHFANTLTLKYAATEGIRTDDTLILRGLACIACAIAGAMYNRVSLVPKDLASQARRCGIAGLAILLLTASYQYATATTVSLISRLDVALLILAGPWIGSAVTSSQRKIAAASLVSLGALAIFHRVPGEQSLGYLLAFAGTCVVTFGYVLLKASSRNENDFVIALTPGIAILLFGVVGRFHHPDGAFAAGLLPASLAIASGVLMFWIYRLTLALYRVMDITLAEYPTLIAALLVLPGEALLLGNRFTPTYVMTLVLNVAALGAILLLKARKQEWSEAR